MTAEELALVAGVAAWILLAWLGAWRIYRMGTRPSG